MKRENTSSLEDLRIADLELFITAARSENLGKAAALHHVSQSAASTAICRVEKALGALLCTHEKRKFALTPEGKQLLPRVEAWMRQLRETMTTTSVPPIRIATTHAIARVAIPPLLALDQIDLQLLRPDNAYAAVLRNEADICLVLDNAPWEGINAIEIGKGCFQLYCTNKNALPGPVLLPEDQIEVLTLQQRWQQLYNQPIAIKARIPSWSLIADICASSNEIGFLPDFLATQARLHPLSWQPQPTKYRILALHKEISPAFHARFLPLLHAWQNTSLNGMWEGI